MKSVAIINKSLPSYRVAFFDRLRDSLRADGVDLHLYHGDAVGTEATKSDGASLPWATFRANLSVTVRGRPLVWQPVLASALSHDLVVVEQASKLLVNYPLLALSKLPGGPRLALWGHGVNLQTHAASRLGEAMKRQYSRLPDWWFAYTESSRARVIRLGYPAERITVVQNAIDTAALQQTIRGLGASDLDAFRNAHGLTSGHVAIYLGSLYPEKRLDYLLRAARAAREIDPRFSLLVGGDGPDRAAVEAAAQDLSYVHYLGRLDGSVKATALASSNLMVMPGLVGLGILDAFAAGTPLVTTDIAYHSPEIDYLEHNRNGLLLHRDTTAESYGHAVAKLLAEREQLATLAANCRADATAYSIETMVENFAHGILCALESPRPRAGRRR